MVERWNKAINLVSHSTVAHLRTRHIADSLQLLQYAPKNLQHWVDLGSGGGFPGLVIAACLADSDPKCRVTLVESDQRKAVFLREAARNMGLETQVIAERIETAQNQKADVVSARALASLSVLLLYAQNHLVKDGIGIFPKGQSLQAEISDAEAAGWKFDAVYHTSVTDQTGNIMIVQKISRV